MMYNQVHILTSVLQVSFPELNWKTKQEKTTVKYAIPVACEASGL